MAASPIDILILILLAWSIRSGFQLGFTQKVWPFCRWWSIALIAPFASPAFSQHAQQFTGLPTVPLLIFGYLIIAAALAWLVEMLERHLGSCLSARDPLGAADPYAGCAIAALATAALVLIAFAVAHPLAVEAIDWNPTAVRTEDAVGELFAAIFGSVHRLLIEDSWSGRWAAQNLTPLLLGK